MTRRAAVFVLMALLLAVLSPVAAAQEEVGITVWPHDGQTFVVGPDQVAVLRAGWAACNKGLVRAYINAGYVEVWLDDEPLLTSDQVDDLWGPLVPAAYIGCDCIRPGRPKPHAAEWRYVANLAPGEYVLRSIMTVTHPVTDGLDCDGDGKPDEFTPENFHFETVNTIIVEE